VVAFSASAAKTADAVVCASKAAAVSAMLASPSSLAVVASVVV
jgi:hypothetical protein